MKILVTGGAGFIGTNLTIMAQQRGHEVTILDDLSTGDSRNLQAHDAQFVEGSILDRKLLDSTMVATDSCIHLAALGSVPRSVADPFATHEVNALGTLNVMEAARKAEIQQVIVASSSSVYGLNPALPKGEREWVRPMSPYAVTKLATEQYALAYQQSYGMRSVAFRFFNVYGPYQRAGHAYAAVIPTFLDALLKSQPLRINGDGLQSRDFTYVGTLCEALLRTAEARVSHPEPVNLAFGSKTSLLGLIQKMEELSGMAAVVTHGAERPGDVKHSQALNYSLLGMLPDLSAVPLTVGLRETINWMREELEL